MKKRYLLFFIFSVIESSLCIGQGGTRNYGNTNAGGICTRQQEDNWCSFAAFEIMLGRPQCYIATEYINMQRHQNSKYDFCCEREYVTEAYNACVKELAVDAHGFMQLVTNNIGVNGWSYVRPGEYGWASGQFPKIGLLGADYGHAIVLEGVSIYYLYGYKECFDVFYADPWYGQIMYCQMEIFNYGVEIMVFW